VGWLLSKIYDAAMRGAERKHLAQWRQEALGGLDGDVIEIGAGTGANLAYYPDTVQLVATEPNPHMRQIAQRKLDRQSCGPRSVEFVSAPAEDLPYPDESFDWAVSTLVLCSVADPDQVLAELRRVLRPEGRLVFVEHVLDFEDAKNRKRQRRYQPLWGLVSDSCQVIRDTEAAISNSGFSMQSIERTRMQVGPSIVRPVIRGRARR